MTTTAKISLLGAALISLASATAARADNQQFRNLNDLQRQQAQPENSALSVAVYANGRGVGGRTYEAQPQDTHFQVYVDGHGRQFGMYVPGDLGTPATP